MYKQHKQMAIAQLTARPGIMKASNPHCEGMKPLFDVVLVGVVDPIAQSELRDSSPVAEPSSEKHPLSAVVFLSDTV